MSNDIKISDEYLEALDNYYTNQLWIASMELTRAYRQKRKNSMQISDCMIMQLSDILEEIRMREGLSPDGKIKIIDFVYDSYKAAVENIKKEVSK